MVEGIAQNSSIDVGFSRESFFIALSSCMLVSAFGTVCNVFLFIKFVTREKKSNGFQVLCLVKTIPNVIVCSIFLIYVVPLTALNFTSEDLGHWLNTFVGCIAAVWCYLLTPPLQVAMSCSRSYVLCFPLGIKILRKFPMTKLYVLVSISTISAVAVTSFAKDCGFIYHPEMFQWFPEDNTCAQNFLDGIVFYIFLLTFITHSFNVCTAVRLLMSKMIGMSKLSSSKRRKRWMITFIQSVLQDCLHLIDAINANFLWKLSDQLAYQFIFLTLSFVSIYALDGLVMLIFNKDIWPKWFQKAKQQTSVLIVDPVRSVTESPL